MCNGEAAKNLDHQLSATSTDGDSRDDKRLLHWTKHHAGKMDYNHCTIMVLDSLSVCIIRQT